MLDRIGTWARTLPQRHGGPVVLALLAVVLLAGSWIRIDQARNPQLATGADQVSYVKLATGLFRDGTYGLGAMPNPTDWSPGAPFMFATVFKLRGGVSPLAARLAQALVSILTLLLIYLLGRRLAGPPRATRGAWGGLIATAFAAFYTSFFRGPAKLLSEPLGTLMVTAAVLSFLWANDRPKPWRYVLPGVVTGLAIFTRPDYLYLLPLFALLALVRFWRALGAAAISARRWLVPGLGAAVIVVACIVIVLAPWTYRNYHVLHRFVPVSTGSGKVLFVATYLPGEGRQVRVKQQLIERFCRAGERKFCGKLWNQVPPESLLNRVAAKYPDMERDAALGRIGRENLGRYLGEDPLGYLKMTVQKPLRMWLRPSRTTTRSKYTAYQKVYHGVVLVLGLVGLAVLCWKRRWEALVVGLTLLGATLLHAILVAVPRHNVPLMGMVMALAGTGAVWIVSLATARLRARSPGGGKPAAAGTASAG